MNNGEDECHALHKKEQYLHQFGKMASMIKTFPSYANATDSDEELQSVSNKNILGA